MTDFSAAREAMVDCQVRPADVTRYDIIEAMLWAPRERFVPRPLRDVAYAGAEIPLAPGRVLLEPRVLAKMFQVAAITPRDLVLDLAPGTGYSTALAGRLAEAVVAVEPDPQLAATARKLMAELEIDNAAVAEGDPAAGDPAHAPYDVILMNGGVERLPDALFDQLRDGGRLVAVTVEGAAGKCRLHTRTARSVTDRAVFDATAPVLAGFERPAEFTF